MAIARMGGSGASLEGGVSSAMDGFVQSAAYMKTAAAEGHFAADPESGRALIDVMRRRIDWLQEQMQNIQAVSQEPPLGSSPSAQTYKPFFASLATDPNEGLGPQLQKFAQVLEETANAIEQSMKNYQETDTGEADRINSISGQIYEI